MLKLEIKKGNGLIQASGGFIEIAADIGYVIKNIYQSLYRRKPEVAILFRERIMYLLSSDGSVWKPVDGKDNNNDIVLMRKEGTPIMPEEVAALVKSGASAEMIAQYIKDAKR